MRRTQKQRTDACDREARKLRDELFHEIGYCELCGPRRLRIGDISWAMELHHIIRVLRPNERCAVLLLCWSCHHLRIHGNEKWPDARQLAVLYASRPKDLAVLSFNTLKRRGQFRITLADVINAEVF
jgi:hypothetical protein